MKRIDAESPGGDSSLSQFEADILGILREWPCVSTNDHHVSGQIGEMLYPVNAQYLQQTNFGMVSGVTGGHPWFQTKPMNIPAQPVSVPCG